MDPREKWNRIYRNKESNGQISYVLSEFRQHLPTTGTALDVACGLGTDAKFLADLGLAVTAWDISEVAIARLKQAAPSVNAVQLDISAEQFLDAKFDVIVSCHFLDRQLMPAMVDAVAPGGHLILQTFTQNKLVSIGPSNPDFLLAEGELLSFANGFEVITYCDEGNNPDVAHPLAGRACIIAKKPA